MCEYVSQVPLHMMDLALDILSFEAVWGDVPHRSLAKVAALLWVHATIKFLTNLGCSSEEIPGVKGFSLPLLPLSVFPEFFSCPKGFASQPVRIKLVQQARVR